MTSLPVRPPRPVPPLRWIAVLAGALALVVLAAMLLPARSDDVPDRATGGTATSVVTEQRGDGPAATAAPTPPGPPVELRIPALDVRAPVVGVALDPDGALEPPADPGVVGWWVGGARPGGDRGAALLTGHTVHDGTGVFDDLAALEVGDTVEVDTRGRTLDFRVRSVQDLTRTRLASSAVRLFDQEGDARLVLVTCTDWDGTRYLGNTVVVARPVRGGEE